jgi:hypothetical protein
MWQVRWAFDPTQEGIVGDEYASLSFNEFTYQRVTSKRTTVISYFDEMVTLLRRKYDLLYFLRGKHVIPRKAQRAEIDWFILYEDDTGKERMRRCLAKEALQMDAKLRGRAHLRIQEYVKWDGTFSLVHFDPETGKNTTFKQMKTLVAAPYTVERMRKVLDRAKRGDFLRIMAWYAKPEWKSLSGYFSRILEGAFELLPEDKGSERDARPLALYDYNVIRTMLLSVDPLLIETPDELEYKIRTAMGSYKKANRNQLRYDCADEYAKFIEVPIDSEEINVV